MQYKLSRRKIAEHVAAVVAEGKPIDGVLQQVAAYLVETRRTREAQLVVRTIEDTLAAKGIVVATVTTARPLDAAMRESIEAMLGAPTIHMREVVDEAIIGGVLVEAPGKKFDASIQRKLLALRRAKQ